MPKSYIDPKKYKKLLNALIKSKLTADEARDLVGISLRTFYRWIHVMQEKGYEVVRNYETPPAYYIVEEEE